MDSVGQEFGQGGLSLSCDVWGLGREDSKAGNESTPGGWNLLEASSLMCLVPGLG